MTPWAWNDARSWAWATHDTLPASVSVERAADNGVWQWSGIRRDAAGATVEVAYGECDTNERAMHLAEAWLRFATETT